MENKETQELKKILKRQLDYLEKSESSMEEVSWNYQEGVLISGNQAKLFLELLKRDPATKGGTDDRTGN